MEVFFKIASPAKSFGRPFFLVSHNSWIIDYTFGIQNDQQSKPNLLVFKNATTHIKYGSCTFRKYGV